MGTRRKQKAEVELIQALCNGDECVRLTQLNLELSKRIETAETNLGASIQNYLILEKAYTQRTKELNTITSKWWCKLFS